MPKKRSITAPTKPGPGPSTLPAPSCPRLSLLERLRVERAQGFHTPERERLMTSDIGRQAYAEARRPLPLLERVLFFERVVEEALQQFRLQNLSLWRHQNEFDAAQIAHHKELFARLVPGLGAVADEIQALLAAAGDEDVAKALRDAEAAVRGTVGSAKHGHERETADGVDRARDVLRHAAQRFDALGRTPEASRCRTIARDLPWDWPSAGAQAGAMTTGLRDSMAASEAAEDLQAVARWLAPVLGLACVEAKLDPTVLREVGNTLSSAGGGLPHLAKTWPEQRARIQVLADQAATAAPASGHKTPEHGPVFEWILVRGERYEFYTDRQRTAVKMLWEAEGRPVHEDAICDVLGAEDCERFRLDHTFRHKGRPIPAWGTVIVKAEPGSRRYRLVR